MSFLRPNPPLSMIDGTRSKLAAPTCCLVVNCFRWTECRPAGSVPSNRRKKSDGSRVMFPIIRTHICWHLSDTRGLTFDFENLNFRDFFRFLDFENFFFRLIGSKVLFFRPIALFPAVVNRWCGIASDWFAPKIFRTPRPGHRQTFQCRDGRVGGVEGTVPSHSQFPIFIQDMPKIIYRIFRPHWANSQWSTQQYESLNRMTVTWPWSRRVKSICRSAWRCKNLNFWTNFCDVQIFQDLNALGQTDLVVSEPIVPFLETLIPVDVTTPYSTILNQKTVPCLTHMAWLFF